MTITFSNSDWEFDFDTIANAGFYVAVRVGFAFPVEERNAFPNGWVEHYTRGGLLMHDPVMKWVYANTGAIRWSDINDDDPQDVLGAATRFGLHYGLAISHQDPSTAGQRTYGNFARQDREFTADEIDTLTAELVARHNSVVIPHLTQAELDALSHIKAGRRIKEAAFELGISESAVKQRLKGAKVKLGAQTNSHAISLASDLRIL